jgi:hypothetical protein
MQSTAAPHKGTDRLCHGLLAGRKIVGMLQAVEGKGTEELRAQAVDTCPDRRELIENLDAVAALVDHPLNTLRLPFDALQPRQSGLTIWFGKVMNAGHCVL